MVFTQVLEERAGTRLEVLGEFAYLEDTVFPSCSSSKFVFTFGYGLDQKLTPCLDPVFHNQGEDQRAPLA